MKTTIKAVMKSNAAMEFKAGAKIVKSELSQTAGIGLQEGFKKIISNKNGGKNWDTLVKDLL